MLFNEQIHQTCLRLCNFKGIKIDKHSGQLNLRQSVYIDNVLGNFKLFRFHLPSDLNMRSSSPEI